MRKQDITTRRVGAIEVICGCMYSGKTEELIRRVKREIIAHNDVLFFNSHLHTRYSVESITTHRGKRLETQQVPESSSEYLRRMIDPQKVDAVAIDEVQFFDEGIVALCDWLADQGVRVIVAGLDMDFRGEPFPGPMSALLAKADKLLKLNAICEICGAPATRSQRLMDGKPAKWDEAILVVGAHENYEARCREHHEIERPDPSKT